MAGTPKAQAHHVRTLVLKHADLIARRRKEAAARTAAAQTELDQMARKLRAELERQAAEGEPPDGAALKQLP